MSQWTSLRDNWGTCNDCVLFDPFTGFCFSPACADVHLPPTYWLRPRLFYWSTLKNSKWLSYFGIYLFNALLCICYCFSHLIGLFFVTWLFLLYKFTRFFSLYSVSLWRRDNTWNVRLILSVSAAHQPFFISIRISSLPRRTLYA